MSAATLFDGKLSAHLQKKQAIVALDIRGNIDLIANPNAFCESFFQTDTQSVSEAFKESLHLKEKKCLI